MTDEKRSNELLPIIRMVAFDLDGTTLNTEDLYLEVLEKLLARRGAKYDPITRAAMLGLPATQAYGALIRHKSLKETVEQLQQECDELFDEILEDKLKLMPGVIKLLDFCDSLSLPRCIATSSRKTFAQRCLKLLHVNDRFDFIVTAEDVDCGKPAPDIYLEAAIRMRGSPPEMLVLEDSPVGLAAAVAAEAFAVAVPNEHTKHNDFSGAAFQVESLEDYRIFDRIRLGR